MSDSNFLIFFGYDGVIFHDIIKKKLKEKAEVEKRIAETFLRLEDLANENSQHERLAKTKKGSSARDDV